MHSTAQAHQPMERFILLTCCDPTVIRRLRAAQSTQVFPSSPQMDKNLSTTSRRFKKVSLCPDGSRKCLFAHHMMQHSLLPASSLSNVAPRSRPLTSPKHQPFPTPFKIIFLSHRSDRFSPSKWNDCWPCCSSITVTPTTRARQHACASSAATFARLFPTPA